MIKDDRKEARALGYFIMMLGYVFLAYDYFAFNKLIDNQGYRVLNVIYHGWFNMDPMLYVGIKVVVLIVSIVTMTFIAPKLKREERLRRKEKQPTYRVLTFIPFLFIVLGFVPGIDIWNFYIYPVVVGLFLVFAGKGFVDLGLNNQTDDIFKKLPKADRVDNMLFQFQAENGIIDMPLPQAGILTQGSQRSGKTASWGEPMIHQAIRKGFGAFIYDYKGSELALTKVAYNTYDRIKTGEIKKEFDWELPEFVNISFTDPLKLSHRINPISPKYLNTFFEAQNLCEAFFKNLDPEMIKKFDFWAKNAVAIASCTMWFLREKEPQYCTVPHFVALMLEPLDTLLAILSTDEETKKRMRPIISAFEKKAEGQMAGAESSAQIPLGKMYNKEVAWVLSADECDLRINNPNSPKILCIANKESMPEILSPLIGLVFQTVQTLMNDNLDYHPTLLSIDELPTIYIKSLDFIPATMGSKKVITHILFQEASQLIDIYGKDQARRIMNMGNKIFCRSNDPESSKQVSEMMGEKDEVLVNASTNSDGTSTSESTQKRKRVTTDMVETQPIGHATGKMMGTTPNLFYTQMKDGSIHKLLNVEKEDIMEVPVLDKSCITNGDDNYSLHRMILEDAIEENFKKINREVKEIVEKYV